jgi:putative hydrolase of HD superfamily
MPNSSKHVSQQDLDELIRFLTFGYQFQAVERNVYIPGTKKWENDAEHCYQLAITAWFLAERHKLDVNFEKLFKYALAHDLVETYAGDITYYDSPEKIAAKHDLETQARKRIAAEFPDVPSLHQTIEDYEKREDLESTFIYALDKLLPTISVYLDNGVLWHEHGISHEKMNAYKVPKMAVSDLVFAYHECLDERLSTNESTLFPKI